MATDTDGSTDPASALRCDSCRSRLAHDQRYCVECGARRGPLPAHIAELISAIHERGRSAMNPEWGSLVEPQGAAPEEPERFGFGLPGPRAAAIAVMGMLCFGLVTGSVVGGGVASLVNAPLLLLDIAPHRAASGTQTVAAAAAPAGASAPAAAVGGGSDGTSADSRSTTQPSATAATTATATTASTTTSTTPSSASGLPPIRHVFLIVLSDHGFQQAFAPSAHAGYLGGALRRQGELLQNYYAVAPSPLANEIALISGQGPTPQTNVNCARFSAIRPATRGAYGQVLGSGCVYPSRTHTLANQLTKAGYRWKTYVQGAGSDTQTACRHPKMGAEERAPRAGQQYLTWRNPFVYFRSLTGGTACRSDEAGIGQLAVDLATESTTPSLSYIIPGACDDGSDQPCRPKAPAGLAAADRFLKSVVPEIERSPAYKANGLIAITFDNAPQTGPHADPSACCNTPAYPNLPSASSPNTTPSTTASPTTTAASTSTATPTTTTTSATTTPTPTTTPSLGQGITSPTGGGGQVGLLLISQYVQADSLDVVDYFNHYSLLASIESLFGLKHLGYAANSQLPVFSASVFNAGSAGF